MGRFFNTKLMNAGKMPEKMESLRKQFNEEQKDGKVIRCQTTQETGIANIKGNGDKGESEPVIPARRGRPRGTGRTHKGNSRKTGRNK